ncbi:site-specific integrase [Bacillus sp. FJAT-28004]|uniref:site-specific integrase n=1 Tax=Bacillus sp. FJAT-28004 TaxID=1679165 RepID=UPI0006B4AA9F|nr:tyrosine-type recombinase/integrase [Bacillus sp. FJAT-28004]
MTQIDEFKHALANNRVDESKYFKIRQKRSCKKTVSDKQRKINHLSSKQKKELIKLHADMDKVMIANSKVTRFSDEKQTKRDAKKGNNGKLGVEGIWSSVTFDRYKRSCRTFLKYCYENFDHVKTLRDIKPRMVGGFIQSLLDKNRSAKTISAYVSAIRKLAESSHKAGIKGHASLVNDKHRSMIPDARKANRRRGSVGGVGYTLREAQIIVKQAARLYSLYEETLLCVLLYGCPRLSETLKISFDQIDYDKQCIRLNKKNQNKNNRPRMAPLPPFVMEKLKQLEVYFPNKQTNIWGRMSEKQVRKLVKSCATHGHVKFCSVHDFRKAGLIWHSRQIKDWSKEHLVAAIMQFVSADVKLNPFIQRNGTLSPKYVPDQLLKRQKRWLMNQYLSQLLGHSRNDATSPYKNF